MSGPPELKDRVPVQAESNPGNRRERKPAGTITREEYLEIYEIYAKRYGRDQSVERLAQRGGFGWYEIIYLTGREAETWEPR